MRLFIQGLCIMCLIVIGVQGIVVGQTVEARAWDTPRATTQTNTTIKSDLSVCTQQLFKVSGYYSAKPGQAFYNRGTYDAEIKLNGRGVNGASGKAVFNGMIAAPRSYEFGTVVVLPGLGNGVVEDRGGAIVNADGYDRIDVWLGEGEDGLHRSRSVGVKWVLGWICPKGSEYAIGMNYDAIPRYTNFHEVLFWGTDQSVGRQDVLVELAQKYLNLLGYSSANVKKGIFDETMEKLVCDFQIENIGLARDDAACGTFGPQTRLKLKSMLAKQGHVSDTAIYALSNTLTISELFRKPNVRPVREPVVPIIDTIDEDEVIVQPTPSIVVGGSAEMFATSINVGERSERVKVLQEILVREGVFAHEVTGYFGSVTKTAVRDFQLKYGLIDSVSHPAAGHLGPATRTLLVAKITSPKPSEIIIAKSKGAWDR